MKRRSMIGAMVLAGTALGLSAPAAAQQRWDWHGGGRGDRDYRLRGAGVPVLLPELRATNRGRAFVWRNFDWNHDGAIEPREARAANRAFVGVAGPRRDRFDWESRDVVVVDRGRPAPPPIAWDRGAMRGYHMRQTRLGATFDIGDVLFETNSARLRPAALDRLRPLAGYLRANPRVSVQIDGHTDSRASDAYNQQLSEARAQSVDEALVRMGASAARFHVEGHGERDPVATNATAAGRQQNRRVEVTLLGRQTREFE